MKQKNLNAFKGYSLSTIAGIANSQYYFVLKVLVLTTTLYTTYYAGSDLIVFGFALFILIEFFNLIYNTFIFGGTKLITSIKKIFTRDGLFVFCCGIIGGPLGAATNLLCAIYAGPVIAVLFALLPGLVTTIFNRIFLKDNVTFIGWMSILATFIGVIGYSCFNLFEANSFSNISGKHVLIGIIFGLLNCIFWGSEVTLLDYVYRRGTGKVKPIDSASALNIKFSSSVFVALLFLPIIDVSSKTSFDHGYYFLKLMFSDTKFLGAAFAASFVLYLVRLGLYFGTSYVKAIYTQIVILAGTFFSPLFLFIYSHADSDLALQWKEFLTHWYKVFFLFLAVGGVACLFLFKDTNIKFAHNLKFFKRKK